MKKVYVLLFAVISCSHIFSQTQTTVTFKPGPDIGQDAVIITHGDCIMNGHTQPHAYQNFGNRSEFSSAAWTWNANGCHSGMVRSLLKFDELSTIPANAVIISAELKLYGISSGGIVTVGNSCYPGSPYNFDCPNRAFIQRITGAWDEQTVTWNTQPTTTTANQITISQTTLQWNWNFTDRSDNLVTMVQDMVANPEANFGFMMKLEIEDYYRSMLFASSDHSNAALWPELTVTYEHCPTETIIIYDTVFVHEIVEIRDTTFIHEPIVISDMIYVQNPCLCGAKGSTIIVYPNPAENGWAIKITANGVETIRIQLSDMDRKIVYSDIKRLISGENSFVIDVSSLEVGNYELRITGNTIYFSRTLLKK
jgi:hypothetical protein